MFLSCKVYLFTTIGTKYKSALQATLILCLQICYLLTSTNYFILSSLYSILSSNLINEADALVDLDDVQRIVVVVVVVMILIQ